MNHSKWILVHILDRIHWSHHFPRSELCANICRGFLHSFHTFTVFCYFVMNSLSYFSQHNSLSSIFCIFLRTILSSYQSKGTLLLLNKISQDTSRTGSFWLMIALSSFLTCSNIHYVKVHSLLSIVYSSSHQMSYLCN